MATDILENDEIRQDEADLLFEQVPVVLNQEEVLEVGMKQDEQNISASEDDEINQNEGYHPETGNNEDNTDESNPSVIEDGEMKQEEAYHPDVENYEDNPDEPNISVHEDDEMNQNDTYPLLLEIMNKFFQYV